MRVGAAAIAREFLAQCDQSSIGARIDLMIEPFEEMRTPFAMVDDMRREPIGVHRDAQHIDRRLEQFGRHELHEQRDGGVRRDHVPVAIDRERGIGLVPFQHMLDDRPHSRHFGAVERSLLIVGGITAREQQRVARAVRHLEAIGEPLQHRRARFRAARLDEAQMPGRNLAVEREVHLAHPAPDAPFAELFAKGCGLHHHSPS